MAELTQFPQPRSEARLLKKEQLLRQFAVLGDLLSAGALLIDVRRTDYEGGTIRGSLNMPAQSFPMNMATLYRLCAGDGLSVISRVIFYCGSSNGRGPRCAGWFKDYIAEQAAQGGIAEAVEVFVLEGGIKGWVQGGNDYISMMEGFVSSYWQQFAEGAGGQKRSVDTSVEDQWTESPGDAQTPAKRRRDTADDIAME